MLTMKVCSYKSFAIYYTKYNISPQIPTYIIHFMNIKSHEGFLAMLGKNLKGAG